MNPSFVLAYVGWLCPIGKRTSGGREKDIRKLERIDARALRRLLTAWLTWPSLRTARGCSGYSGQRDCDRFERQEPGCRRNKLAMLGNTQLAPVIPPPHEPPRGKPSRAVRTSASLLASRVYTALGEDSNPSPLPNNSRQLQPDPQAYAN